MPLRLLPLLAVAALAACSPASEPAPEVVPDPHLDRLAAWMTGEFDSAKQAAEDPEYHDIRLRMAPIWPGREDGHWMYVEQAVAAAEDRPYRQRVYHVTHVGRDLYESRVFELPDPEARIGAWKKEAPLADLTPDDLVVREGAAIILRRVGDRFVGSTLGRLCRSDFRGAAYATSEVEIGPEAIVSWDRGFDANGKHVWGAVKGGYVFDKKKDFPLR
jgi:CpeT protein